MVVEGLWEHASCSLASTFTFSLSGSCKVQTVLKSCNHACTPMPVNQGQQEELTRQRREPHRQRAEGGRPRQACLLANSLRCISSVLRHHSTTTYKTRTQIHTGSSPTTAQKESGLKIDMLPLCVLITFAQAIVHGDKPSRKTHS